MAIDLFLAIEDIIGESTDRDHPGEIEVLAYSLGFSNTGDAVQPGAGRARAQRQNLSVTVYHSKASLPLFLAVATGRMLPEATLTARRAGATPFEFLTIKLEQVLVTSDSIGVSGGEDRPTENYSFDYARITFTYVERSPSGVLLPPINAGFDFATNTPI